MRQPGIGTDQRLALRLAIRRIREDLLDRPTVLPFEHGDLRQPSLHDLETFRVELKAVAIGSQRPCKVLHLVGKEIGLLRRIREHRVE